MLRELARVQGHQSTTVLGFTELQPAIDLFPEFRFELIPRQELLDDLTQRNRPWYRAGWVLEKVLKKLAESRWDLLANLSHTSFSARLMDCLEAKEKWGVQYENGKSAGWNPWLVEMNNNWVDNLQPQLTYAELLAKGMGLTLSGPVAPKNGGTELWLQPLTSDEKKNWSMGNWQFLAKYLSKNNPVRVIAAPSESRILTPWFDKVEVLTFLQMRAQKEACRLLVSGDTSVVHFAALEGIATFGIYLGSANPYKTPPRQLGAKMAAGLESCWPCAHRSPCSQATHRCGEAVNAKEILKQIENELIGKSMQPNGRLEIFEVTEGGVNGQGRRRTSAEYTQEA